MQGRSQHQGGAMQGSKMCSCRRACRKSARPAGMAATDRAWRRCLQETATFSGARQSLPEPRLLQLLLRQLQWVSSIQRCCVKPAAAAQAAAVAATGSGRRGLRCCTSTCCTNTCATQRTVLNPLRSVRTRRMCKFGLIHAVATLLDICRNSCSMLPACRRLRSTPLELNLD